MTLEIQDLALTAKWDTNPLDKLDLQCQYRYKQMIKKSVQIRFQGNG